MWGRIWLLDANQRIYSSNTEKTQEDKIRVAMFKFRRQRENKTAQERDAQWDKHMISRLFSCINLKKRRHLMYFFWIHSTSDLQMNVMCGGPTHWHHNQYGIHTYRCRLDEGESCRTAWMNWEQYLFSHEDSKNYVWCHLGWWTHGEL